MIWQSLAFRFPWNLDRVVSKIERAASHFGDAYMPSPLPRQVCWSLFALPPHRQRSSL
jgi:hypothetical protein